MNTCSTVDRQPWMTYAILGLLTLLAAYLRFHHLEDWSYFVDELHTSVDAPMRADRSLFNLLLVERRQAFWLLTNFAFDIFGMNAFALRIWPCLFGILTVPILYFVTKAIVGQQIALLSAFLLAISHWHIFMSQMARWYSLLLLTSLLSLVSFYIYIETRSTRYLLIFLFMLYFSLTLHLSAFFIIIIAYTYILLLLFMPSFRASYMNTKRLALFVGLPLLAMPLCIREFQKFLIFWEEAKWYNGSYGEDIFLKSIYQVTPSVLIATLAGAILLIYCRDRKGLFFSIYAFLPLFVLNFATAFQLNVSTRYVLFSLPAFLILASFFCIYIYRNLRTNHNIVIIFIIIFLLCSLTLQSDYFYYTNYYGNRGRLREAISFLQAHHLPTDYYMPHGLHAVKNRFVLSQTATLDGFDLPDLQILDHSLDFLPSDGRIWILTLNHLTPHAKGLMRWMAEQTHLVAEYPADFGPQDYTLKIYLYTPPNK